MEQEDGGEELEGGERGDGKGREAAVVGRGGIFSADLDDGHLPGDAIGPAPAAPPTNTTATATGLLPFPYEACPGGRGLDTHRIYEALALGVAPVVAESPLTEAFLRRSSSSSSSSDDGEGAASGLFPIVPVRSDWSDLDDVVRRDYYGQYAVEKGAEAARNQVVQGAAFPRPSSTTPTPTPAASAHHALASPAGRMRVLLRLTSEWWALALLDKQRELRRDARDIYPQGLHGGRR